MVSLEEILASAPGPEPGGIPGLTEEEFANFMAAVHGEFPPHPRVEGPGS